jgi:AcrR family transcriptional regulator
MDKESETDRPMRSKPRVIKAPAARRAELIDCAQRLFLAKGYERTTINDVIAATGLSKGAFYHHFAAKEDLLEAIAGRFAEQAVVAARAVWDDASLDALGRLNRLLAMNRQWKAENLRPLSAMLSVLLKPESAILYHRIVSGVFQALAPALSAIIAGGVREGVFDVASVELTAEALLGLSEGRRSVVVEAMQVAQRGEVDRATAMIMDRVRAEEAMVDRLLGLPPGSVDLAGSEAFIRSLIVAWGETPPPTEPVPESKPSASLSLHKRPG